MTVQPIYKQSCKILTFHRAFFQFTERQTPTNTLHIQQYISLECQFQC